MKTLVLLALLLLQDPFPNPFSQPPVPLATLTVTTAGTGSGTVTGTGISCGSDCTQVFNRGASVTLTASPTGSASFVGWSGGCTGTGSCVVTMAGAKTVTATFNVSSGGGTNTPPFFMSAEAGCGTDPTVLLCDDIDDGRLWAHASLNDIPIDPLDDGWKTQIDAGITPSTYVLCGGVGVKGTACAARAILDGSDGGGPGHMVLTHALSGNPGLTAIRGRVYIKFLSGYNARGNQKFVSGQAGPHDGGIRLYGIGHDLRVMHVLPQEDGNGADFHNPATLTGGGTGNFGRGGNCSSAGCAYLGDNLIDCFMGQDDVWYYFEYRIQLNTSGVRNGQLDTWSNNCGASGVCTGSPRHCRSYTNVIYRGPILGETNMTIGGYYQDIWGNPADIGTLLWDQLVITTDAHGQIGFMQ